jgi:hypothetical protein
MRFPDRQTFDDWRQDGTRLFQRFVRRVRRAKHPLHGWRKAAVITGQATAGLIGLFAVINLVLSLLTFGGEDPLARTVHELRVLWFSPLDGQPMGAGAFATVYGHDLGPTPDTGAIHAYLEDEAEDGVFLLDHVMIDRILALNGRVDARAIPAGVYASWTYGMDQSQLRTFSYEGTATVLVNDSDTEEETPDETE